MFKHICLLCFLLISIKAWAEPINIISGMNAPPFSVYHNGKIYGLTKDLLDYVIEDFASEKNSNFSYFRFPWEAAWDHLGKEQYSIFLDMSYEVSTRAGFSENRRVGPYYRSEYGLIGKVSRFGRNIPFRRLLGLNVGVLRGSYAFNRLVNQGYNVRNFIFYDSMEDAVHAIDVGEVDLLAVMVEPAYRIMLENAIDPLEFSQVYKLGVTGLYFAFSKKFKNSEINDFKMRFNEYKQNGYMSKILIKYGLATE